MKEQFVEFLFKGIKDKIKMFYEGDMDEYLRELHYEELNEHVSTLHQLVKEVLIP